MPNGRYDRGREDRDLRSQRNSWNEDPSQRYSRDRDDRGFIERAGEQLSSWFGDDNSDRSDRPGRREERAYERRPQATAYDHEDRGQRFREESFRPSFGGRSRPEGREEYRPMAGDYGRSSGREMGGDMSGGMGRDMNRDMGRESGGQGYSSFGGGSGNAGGLHDPHYSEWRNRQMSELDRDYEEYRRENQARFESDFGNWRSTRQTKRQMLGSIREHMQVVGSDEQPVGTVDKVRGDQVILTRTDSPDGQHHCVSCAMIDRIEGDRVILDKNAEEAKRALGTESQNPAMFDRQEDREPGAHMLNRSFSGTY